MVNLHKNRYQGGVTYLAVLLLVALMGAILATTGIVWKNVQQREKERELLFVGNEFRKAILLYYHRTPGGMNRYPQSLEDLLRDSRYPLPQRYLRKIYIDPMTKKTDWGIVVAPEGGVMGVYSLSDEIPIKTGNFSLANEEFEGKNKYSDWQFVYRFDQNPKNIPSKPLLFIAPYIGSQ